MIHPEKVKNKTERPEHYRKLAKSGGSRYIAVGNILPRDWAMVGIKAKRVDEKLFILEIRKLA